LDAQEDDNLQRRGQELASIRSMEELQEVALELAKDIQAQYGVSITLSVVDPPIDEVEEDFRPEVRGMQTVIQMAGQELRLSRLGGRGAETTFSRRI